MVSILELVPSPVVKMVAKRVELSEVPDDCRVYLFYFTGYPEYKELEKSLAVLGKKTGKNLYIGFWSMADPRYDQLAKSFKLKNLPAIVVTGHEQLASIENVTVYARVDSGKLLIDTNATMNTVERLYHDFLRGLVTEALTDAKKAGRLAEIKYYLGKLKDGSESVLGGIKDFLEERDIEVSIFEGKFILKKVK